MENNNEKRIKLTFNKKVISISFLALALFMLLAVSYAYFTATVTGNEDAKKTTLTTGIMAVKLTGPTEVTTKENMVPGESVELTFTVTNTGTVATYYNLDMIDVSNDFNPKSDLVYSVKSDKGANSINTVAPSDDGTLIPNIYIGTGTDNVHSYTLTLTFLETHSNQNSNQGKTFTGKVQISGLKENAIATTILNNNPVQDSTRIDFSKGSPQSDGTENGTGLYAAPDDDGISYYFRGAVENNNVFFAGKNWKILRINGDGSIRLVYNDEKLTESNFNYYTWVEEIARYELVGFTRNNKPGYECTKTHPCEVIYDKEQNDFINNNSEVTNSDVKTTLETWYKSNLNSVDDQIAYGFFCNDVSYESGSDDGSTSKLSFGASKRISNGQPTLICPEPNNSSGTPRTYGGLYKTKIGLITADELNLAGYGNSSSKVAYETNYLYHDYYWWSLTPNFSNNGANVFTGSNGYVNNIGATHAKYTVVPVINLKANVTFTGDGTKFHPYVVN